MKRKGYFQYEVEDKTGLRSLGNYLKKRKFRDARLDHFALNRRKTRIKIGIVATIVIAVILYVAYRSTQGLMLYY